MSGAKNLLVLLLFAASAAWAVPEVDQPAPALKARFSPAAFRLRKCAARWCW